jgi:S-adenosylmethionine decarboxylase
VAVDVYVGDAATDQSAKARGLMFALVNRFQPEWTEQRSLDRGEEE